MALPTSRNENCVPGTPVKSATINAIQDAIVGNKKPTMYRQSLIRPQSFIAAPNLSWITIPGEVALKTSTGDTWMMALDMEAGDRITGVELRVRGDGGSDVLYTLAVVNPATQAQVTICTGTDSNRAAAYGTLNLATLGAFTATVIQPYSALFLFAAATSGEHRWSTIRWAYDRL